MKSVVFWAILPFFLSASSAHAAQLPPKVNNLPYVANKYIIEVDTLANIPNKREYKRSLDAVYATLAERKIPFGINKEFDTEGIFVGASLTLNTAEDVAAVQNTAGIKAIRPVRSFPAPVLAKKHLVTGPSDPEIPADSQSTHVMTGVNKIHAEGNIGQGIKIGIIDTGIDYKHPALGGGIGPNFLVKGGYDFAGDAYTGENTPVPDADPFDCAGHGTHVAGIIAAQPGNPYNITGAAYGADVYAYRVFGCEGSVSEEVIVEALIRGYKDGNDILTMSLGGADGWAASSSAVVSDRLAKLGKIVTIAAGNDGDVGSWYSSSPGNAHNAISVASVENTVILLQAATVRGADHAPIPYFATNPFPVVGELPVYVLTKDITITNDACTALPADTPDLSNYIVIIRRGGCNFTDKLANAAAKGAKQALIYDNGNGFAGISVGNYVATLIQAADGEWLVSQAIAGNQIYITFPQGGQPVNYPSERGGLISTFSSYGPSNDFHFKPAVAGPGGNILSTYPTALGNGYAVLSGTSMATPFLAGVSALLLKAKGRSTVVAKGARDLFETTASKIPSSLSDGEPFQTVTQAGAGLIDAYKAIHTTTIVSPGELILNDTAHFDGIQTFTVSNKGNTVKKYKLTHVPAGTALTIQPGSIFAAHGPVPLSTAAATAHIIPSSFILLPGASQLVIASFKPPTGLDASTYPVYSGFIDIVSGADSTHVSYVGLLGSLYNKEVLDNTEQLFGIKLPALLNAAGDKQTAPTNYTFANGDFPSVLWKLAFGTPAVRVDLVEAAVNFTPTLTSRGFGDFLSIFFPGIKNGGSYAKVKVAGSLASFDYISRQADADYSMYNLEKPTFANGTAIPVGSYRVLIRALKVTGNPSREEDYESWLSPILGINGA